MKRRIAASAGWPSPPTPRLRQRTILAVLTAASLARCTDGPPDPIPMDPAAHRAAVDAFAAARTAELQAPESWLSLAGLLWLSPGENTMGSAQDNDVVLPAEAPPRLGTLTVGDSTVTWVTAPGVTVTQGVDSTLSRTAGSGPVSQDASGDPAVTESDMTADVGQGKFVVLRHGDLSWIIIRRGDRWAVRLRDDASHAYALFAEHGIDRFPTSETWRVTARWVPHDKTVAVPNVLGTVAEVKSPAVLEFWVDGRRMTLDVAGEPEHGQYMLVFADSTSGRESYGGGRYVWIDEPDADNRVVIDFNRAYNPPCVWTAFATCTLPTRDNRLPAAVEAGEKMWVNAHH